MPSITIHIKDLGNELRALPKRDHAAIIRGIHRTLSVDAHRWIQWSLRGGGMGGGAQPRPKKPPKPKKPKVKVRLLRRLVTRLGNALGIFRGKKPKSLKAQKAKDPCAPKDPPAYRKPIDTGDYARSWIHELTENGGAFYSAASPPVKAGVIELGRRPAPIPIRPLAEWVRRKFGCTDPKKALGIAIAISKVAAETPRPGLRVLHRAHPKISEAAKKNIEREIRRTRPGRTS